MLNELSKQAHTTAKEKGFYDEGDRNIPELLMLIVSELSEALEEYRRQDFNQDKFNEEIADVFIRLFDLCGYLDINIEEAIKLKMDKNSKRPYKHGKRL